MICARDTCWLEVKNVYALVYSSRFLITIAMGK